MSASRYDFIIEQGSSYQISFFYKDSDSQPIDLTNWCARLVWKTDTGIIQEFRSGNEDHNEYTFSLNDSTGEIRLLLPASTTSNFKFTSAKYDLDLKSPAVFTDAGDNYVSRILYGTVSILARGSATTTDNIC
jgi:hypothetical protein